MSDRLFKRLELILWIALAAMLVPMCAAAFYNRPTVDDLCQPLEAMRAVQNGGGLWEVLKIGWDSMARTYQQYCGTFFTMFLSYILGWVA